MYSKLGLNMSTAIKLF
ncbi:MAG: hypothetical protein Q4D88_00525 [Anaerococcus sp.]|nr:hypothetical protein [Anaerococcus sp.]